MAQFVERLITDFDGYIWDLRYGDYIIGQQVSIKHLGLLVYEDFTTQLTEPEVLNSFKLVISKPVLITALAAAKAEAEAANGGSLPPSPAPQYTLTEAMKPNNTFWQLKNDQERTVWFPVRVRKVPIHKTWHYEFRLVEQGI